MTAPRPFDFPADHGAHPDYRNEWWYFTGNLDAEDGRRFGFELTVFRFSLTPERPGERLSRWATNQVYIGHFAITDVADERFLVAQRYARGAAGLAGVTSTPLEIWIENWAIRQSSSGRWQLSAADSSFGIDLTLDTEKDIVLNGDRGYSQKSAEQGNASYYYSMTRLATSGALSIDGESIAVSGLSWLDREWGSSALSRDQAGWDWFALQLDDGSDLMAYVLRGTDGQPDPYSAGTFVSREGVGRALGADDIALEVLDYWTNEAGDRYPSGWRLEIAGEDLVVEIQPVLDNQELITNVRYWEGAVDVSGRRAGSAVSGRGYVELTGYAADDSG